MDCPNSFDISLVCRHECTRFSFIIAPRCLGTAGAKFGWHQMDDGFVFCLVPRPYPAIGPGWDKGDGQCIPATIETEVYGG